MGGTDELGYGWLTPGLSWIMAVLGSALGLRCMVRAIAADGRSRRNWLITGASAIGVGIWTMHFIAMLGFTVTGTEIRYDVPVTLLSLLVAILFVGVGAFAVGYGRHRNRSLLLGGLTTGLGITAMHYIGMDALRLHGAVGYRPLNVAVSAVIAIVAATAALWAGLNIRGPLAAGAAAVVMGLAVSSMHYTGMSAIFITVHPEPGALPGVTAIQFIFPLAVGLGSALFLTSAFVALSPTTQPPGTLRSRPPQAAPSPAPAPREPATAGGPADAPQRTEA